MPQPTETSVSLHITGRSSPGSLVTERLHSTPNTLPPPLLHYHSESSTAYRVHCISPDLVICNGYLRVTSLSLCPCPKFTNPISSALSYWLPRRQGPRLIHYKSDKQPPLPSPTQTRQTVRSLKSHKRTALPHPSDALSFLFLTILNLQHLLPSTPSPSSFICPPSPVRCYWYDPLGSKPSLIPSHHRSDLCGKSISRSIPRSHTDRSADYSLAPPSSSHVITLSAILSQGPPISLTTKYPLAPGTLSPHS